MPFDRDVHHRRSIRLRAYDYTSAGAYFVTICTHRRVPLFGVVHDGEMELGSFGQIVVQCWAAIPEHFAHAELDEFVIMPNHVHGIIVIPGDPLVGARHALPLQDDEHGFGKPIPGSLPTIVGSFKSAATKTVNRIRDTPGQPVWQRNYHEHVIRNAADLSRLRRYIAANPVRWEEDRYFPAL